jgi:antitoxin (DNA-binding transcriptional repressor) of toxin-antitoxin stability system
METLELKKASRPLADYAVKLVGEGIVITSKRKPVAALVSLKGADRESLSLSMNPSFMKIIRRARSEVNRGKVIPLGQLKQEVLAEAGAPNKRMQPPRDKRRAHAGRRAASG